MCNLIKDISTHDDSSLSEYPSWTFGHENTTSYSTFNILETHGENFTISFIMRSLKHNGLLLQLHREEKPYLTVYLKEGTVAIYSPHTTLLSEAKLVTNGHSNLVTMMVRYGHVVFPKAGHHRALGNVSVEAGDVAYIGGLPEGKNMNAWGGNFKGCLQDIRLDQKHLTIGDHPEEVELYPSSTEENVLQECQSDNTCKVKTDHHFRYRIARQKFKNSCKMVVKLIFFDNAVSLDLTVVMPQDSIHLQLFSVSRCLFYPAPCTHMCDTGEGPTESHGNADPQTLTVTNENRNHLKKHVLPNS